MPPAPPALRLGAPVVCRDGAAAPDLARLLPPAPLRLPSLPQVRQLLRALLPLPCFDLTAALALLAYQQRHNTAAYQSHRKRTLQLLTGQAP